MQYVFFCSSVIYADTSYKRGMSRRRNAKTKLNILNKAKYVNNIGIFRREKAGSPYYIIMMSFIRYAEMYIAYKNIQVHNDR